MNNRHFVINYNHDSDHAHDTLMNGTIGIPNKSGTAGRRILSTLTSDKPGYGILYDVSTKSVRGFFSTLGEHYVTGEVDTFEGSNENLNWGHRIKVMSHISPDESITAEDFRAMGGKTRKGSITRISKDVWIKVKERLAK